MVFLKGGCTPCTPLMHRPGLSCGAKIRHGVSPLKLCSLPVYITYVFSSVDLKFSIWTQSLFDDDIMDTDGEEKNEDTNFYRITQLRVLCDAVCARAHLLILSSCQHILRRPTSWLSLATCVPSAHWYSAKPPHSGHTSGESTKTHCRCE